MSIDVTAASGHLGRLVVQFPNRHNAGVHLSHLERIAGFHYDHPSAEDAWNRIQRFFHTHLGG